VVRAGLEVAGDGHAEPDPPVARQQIQHVVEEADAGGDPLGGTAVEVQRHRDVGLAGLARQLCGATHA
jgi:hypothetical protein